MKTEYTENNNKNNLFVYLIFFLRNFWTSYLNLIFDKKKIHCKLTSMVLRIFFTYKIKFV